MIPLCDNSCTDINRENNKVDDALHRSIVKSSYDLMTKEHKK